MCRVLVIATVLVFGFFFEITLSANDNITFKPQIKTQGADYDFGDNAPVAKKPANRYGLQMQIGILRGQNLYFGDSSLSVSGIGFPLSGGIFYFPMRNIIVGANLSFTPIPSWLTSWDLTTRWSLLEYGINLKILISPSLDKSYYFGFGFKMARLGCSRKSVAGLLGGTVTPLRFKTTFAPALEITFGSTGIPPRKAGLILELAFKNIFMKNRSVKNNDAESTWNYPQNLIFIGIRMGLMIPLDSRRNSENNKAPSLVAQH